ncbi:MAG: hypothetical protein HKP30_17155, partial [Myxococcales bacterium]|nr:hypothetical protein [Myxococcales bacterium]
MSRALLVVFGFVALAVVAVLIAVPVLIQRNLSVEAVEARASVLAGRPVSVERVRIAFRPGLRIRAEGVVIEGGGAADAIEVELAVLPLLRRRVEPSELHLRGVRLAVERGPEGGLRLRLLHPPGRGAREGGGPLPALPALEARDGEIFLVDVDGAAIDAPVLEILRFEQGPLATEGRAPVRLDVALSPGEGGGLGFERMRLEGFLERSGDAVRIHEGRVRGDALQWKGLRLQDLAGRFDYADGRVGIDRLAFSGYEGEISFAGSIRTQRPPRLEGRLGAQGLDLSALVADARGSAPGLSLGPLDLDGQVALILRATETGSGEATMTIQGGELPAASLFTTLL